MNMTINQVGLSTKTRETLTRYVETCFVIGLVDNTNVFCLQRKYLRKICFSLHEPKPQMFFPQNSGESYYALKSFKSF